MDAIMNILTNVLDWIETYVINGFMGFFFPFLLALLTPFL